MYILSMWYAKHKSCINCREDTQLVILGIWVILSTSLMYWFSFQLILLLSFNFFKTFLFLQQYRTNSHWPSLSLYLYVMIFLSLIFIDFGPISWAVIQLLYPGLWIFLYFNLFSLLSFWSHCYVKYCTQP